MDGIMVFGMWFIYIYELGDDIGGGDFSVFDVKIFDSLVINSFF